MTKTKAKGQPYKVAVAEGLRFYFSGEPCKNGNIAMRRTSSRACICEACANERSAKNLGTYYAKKLEREGAQNLENAQGAE